jgi:hypothetical protein
MIHVHQTLTYFSKFTKQINNMAKPEIKSDIPKSLNRVTENALPDVLDCLRQVKDQSMNNVNLNNCLKTILNEDQHLLQCLAQ